MGKILIKNGKIWDGNTFYYADILTNDKYIEKIEKNITDSAYYVFDATDKIVSAGLIDIHVHLKDISPEAFGTQAEMSSFPFGVTTVNDAGAIYGTKATLDSFSVKNTVFIAPNIKNNHVDLENAQNLLNKFENKVVGIKICFDITNQNISDLTPLKEICHFARLKNLKVMVHCSNSPTPMIDIIKILSSGDILTHAFHGGKNACFENDYESLKLAKEKNIIIDVGFAGHIHTNFKNLKDAIASGFYPDTISTDITCLSAFIRGGKYGLTMCMSIAKHLGMSEEYILKSVTSSPASVLGKADEWGTLDIGKIADIAVLDYTDEGFNLTDNAGNQIQSVLGYRCVLTLSDGQVVYRY